MLAGFGLSSEEALFDNELPSNWSYLFSLPRKHAEVGLQVARRVEQDGSAPVTSAEKGVLLRPADDDFEIRPESFEHGESMLYEVGVEWKKPS